MGNAGFEVVVKYATRDVTEREKQSWSQGLIKTTEIEVEENVIFQGKGRESTKRKQF